MLSLLYWKPTLSSIEINPVVGNIDIPQAWSNIVDWVEYWYYNFQGAKQESEYRWELLPTIDQLIEEIKNSSREFSPAGYRYYGDNNKFYGAWKQSYILSSTPVNDTNIKWAEIGGTMGDVMGNWFYCGHGLSVYSLLK